MAGRNRVCWNTSCRGRIGRSIVSIERNRRSEIHNAAIVVLLRAIGDGTVVEAHSILWVELHGFAIVSDGAVIIAFGGIRTPASRIGGRFARIQANSFGQVRYGEVIFLLDAICDAAAVEGVAASGVNAKDGHKIRNGIAIFAFARI
jgi:hypothetical protein